MLTKIKIKPSYSTLEDDFASDFFIPVLSNSNRFYRVSAYFNSKSLSEYIEGMKFFAENKGKYKLIVSKEISNEEFEEIKKGYQLRESTIKSLLDGLESGENGIERKRLGEISYLIEKGILEVKIAFKKVGRLHDKFGYVEDANGNKLVFIGSNNQTIAGQVNNSESFHVTCNWLSSDFEKTRIQDQYNMFEKMWNNEYQEKGLYILDIPTVIKNRLLKFREESKENLELKKEEDLILKLSDSKLLLLFNKTSLLRLPKMKSRILTYFIKQSDSEYISHEGLSYEEMKSIIEKIIELSKLEDFDLLIEKKIYERNTFRFTSIPFVSFTDRRIAVRGLFQAYEVAKELNLDIIHTQTEFSMGLIGKFVAKILKIPCLHTYHTMYEKYLQAIKKPTII